MKGTFSILFFLLCSLFSSLDAQIQTYPNCDTSGWLEIIILFPPDASDAAINYLKGYLHAHSEDSIPTLKAHLWRICRGDISVDGHTYPINSTSDLIGHIRDQMQSIGAVAKWGQIWTNPESLKKTGIDSNHTVSIARTNSTVVQSTNRSNHFGSETSLLPPAYTHINEQLTTLCGNFNTPIQATRKPVSIYVLDSGNKGGREGTGNELIDYYLNTEKAKCFITNSNNPRQTIDSAFVGTGVDTLVGAKHGTNVISIIANTLDKLSGRAEFLQGSITSVKVLNAKGRGSYWQYLQGFAYALDNNAQVINSSIIIKSPRDTSRFSTPLAIAIEYAERYNTMVVAGSGNDTIKLSDDKRRFLPADTTNTYLITVAASNAGDSISYFSNYGHTGGLMVAPGVGVNAMGLDGNVSEVKGTSFSTPFVTATYAFLKYMSPNSSDTLLKKNIFNTTNPTLNLVTKPTDYGILNMPAAIRELKKKLCPSPLTPSVAEGTTQATVSWTPVSGMQQGYILEYKAAIPPTTAVSWTKIPLSITTTSYIVSSLIPNTPYYVRVKTDCSNCSKEGIISLDSNQRNFTTLAFPILPLELVSFNAFITKEREVALTWTTLNEVNIAHFEVQRSINAKSWQTLGTAKPYNTSDRHVYALNDPNKDNTEGVLYYRIRIVELDGSEKFSYVKAVNFNAKKGKISLYPNPAHSGIYINSALDGKIKAEIVDPLGRILIIKELEITNGQAYLAFDNRLNGSGIYAMRLFQNNQLMDIKSFMVD